MTTDRRVSAAEGYLMLNLPEDAWSELEEIDFVDRDLLPVVMLRLEILTMLKRWEDVAALGRGAIQRHPESGPLYLKTSYGVRRCEGLPAAHTLLSKGEIVLADDGLYQFNMACYECQLGELTKARERLTKAIKIDERWRMMALEDRDLEPLWVEIERL